MSNQYSTVPLLTVSTGTIRWPNEQQFGLVLRAVTRTTEGADLVEWVRNVSRPSDSTDLALRLTFVIIVSGFRYCVAKKIFERVDTALNAGRPVCSVYGHSGKGAAIDWIWRRRQVLFATFERLLDSEVVGWCDKLPWIGPITKYQAARDLGLDVAKPDRHMSRLAARTGETVEAMCARVAHLSGERVGTVDLVLWFGLAHGIIRIDDDPRV